MNKINIENREEWFFEYHEGDLPLDQRIDVERFVEQNPEFEQEFLAWGKAKVVDEGIQFDGIETILQDDDGGKKWGWILIPILCLCFVTGYFYSSTKEMKVIENIEPTGSVDPLVAKESVNFEPITPLSKNEPNINALNEGLKVSPIATNSHQPKDKEWIQLINSNKVQKVATSEIKAINVSKDKVNLKELIVPVNAQDNNLVTYFPADEKVIKYLDQFESTQDKSISELDSNLTGESLSSLDTESSLADTPNDLIEGRIKKIKLVNQFDLDFVIPGLSTNQFSPSFAGNRNKFKMESYFYSFDRGFTLTPISKYTNVFNFSLDGYVNQFRGGIGIRLYKEELGNRSVANPNKSDEAYELGQYQFSKTSIFYSPKIRINDGLIIEPGIAYNLLNYQFYDRSISDNNQYDIPGVSFSNDSVPGAFQETYTSADFGLQLNMPGWTVGLSLDNVHANWYVRDVRFDQHAQPVFKANIGTYIRFKKDAKWMLLPSAFMIHDTTMKLWVTNGLKVECNDFFNLFVRAGVSNGKEYSFASTIELQSFRLNYRYAKMTNNYLTQPTGIHQLGMSLNIK